MASQSRLNERSIVHEPIAEFLIENSPHQAAGAKLDWVLHEWVTTRKLWFKELENVTCNEKWSVEAINRANAFNHRVERDFVIMHVGTRSLVVDREYARRLVRLQATTNISDLT